MGASGRGRHLAALGSSARTMPRNASNRLNPAEYMARKKRDPRDVKAVVLLFAHSGVVRPTEWLQLLQPDSGVSLLIHCYHALPPELQPFRYPRTQVTAWGDISLFVLLRRMLRHAQEAYPQATIFYTCPGNGVPLVDAATLARQQTSILGIPTRVEKATKPAWEALRAKAMLDVGLPTIPPRCYGSTWIALSSDDAALVVKLGEKHDVALHEVYRATYAYASEGHGCSEHSRVHPDEEFVAYLIHVVSCRPWPTVYEHIMAEVTESPPPTLCEACGYRVGHAAPLSAQQEARMRDRPNGALFMRKVQPVTQ